MWDRYWIFLQRPAAWRSRRLASPRAGRCSTTSREYAPATLELATIAFLLSLLVGLPLGVLAAVRRDSWIDHIARVVSLIGVSAPTFWLAFIMLAIFYGWLDMAPGPGQLDPVAFPPDRVTGLLLIDTVLAGRLGDLPRRRRASGAAVDRAGQRHARA